MVLRSLCVSLCQLVCNDRLFLHNPVASIQLIFLNWQRFFRPKYICIRPGKQLYSKRNLCLSYILYAGIWSLRLLRTIPTLPTDRIGKGQNASLDNWETGTWWKQSWPRKLQTRVHFCVSGVLFCSTDGFSDKCADERNQSVWHGLDAWTDTFLHAHCLELVAVQSNGKLSQQSA